MTHPWRRKENLTKMKVAVTEIDLSTGVDNKMTRNQTLALDPGVDAGN